jgi:hypothetical protein
LGIVIDVNTEQPLNVCSSIIVKNELVGSVTDANEIQLLNALKLILVTELGIIIDVNA